MTIKKINSRTFLDFDPSTVPSPCFVVDEVAIEKNLEILANVQQASGAKILMALKAFSMFSLAPLVKRYLSGTCASGLHEARLGREEFGGEVHTYSAAYASNDFNEILNISDHVVFNSFNQWETYSARALETQTLRPNLKFGLRINPLHSEGATPIYDPCAPGSRLGIPITQLSGKDLTGISGIHFHTLCEQGYEPLSRTLDVIETQCETMLHNLEWVNFGGGHHITDPDYDTESLIERIKNFRERYQVDVYLEPGEAIAINTGVLVCEVLDIIQNDMSLAILDTSATCHMPDTLEMPYRAHIFNSGEKNEKEHTYRLGGQTCLAGDVMGDYSFDRPLDIAKRLIFDDMSHYTMVKTSTFNGINLPSIAIWNSTTNEIKVVKSFGYEDFKSRLS